MFNFIKKQFIDVIQWPNPDDSLLMWRFPIADEEIQNGASLTVREAQMAMFVDEGVTADVFGPGRYTLNTQTLPLLTNLKNWDKLFESPFKSDVYFFNTKQQLARKWGDVATRYRARCRVRRGAVALVRYVRLPHQRSGKILQRSQRCSGRI